MANAAEVYPDNLCKHMVQGLLDQMKLDARLVKGGVGSVMCSEEGTSK